MPVPDRPFTVLIADDDPDDRMLLQDAWDETDPAHRLRFVQDGEELMEELQSCDGAGVEGRPAAPDLIILDLNMPRKDGREALREIKADRRLRRIPVVILTTDRKPANLDRAVMSGATGWVLKPYEPERLIDTVGKIIQKSR